MIVKCGHKDLALRELEGVKETLGRMKGSDLRASIFGRLCNLYAPMPQEMTQLLLLLKANSWHVKHPNLDWSGKNSQKSATQSCCIVNLVTS